MVIWQIKLGTKGN